MFICRMLLSWIAVQTQIIVMWSNLVGFKMDNFMRNNFGKRYFMRISFSFQGQ